MQPYTVQRFGTPGSRSQFAEPAALQVDDQAAGAFRPQKPTGVPGQGKGLPLTLSGMT